MVDAANQTWVNDLWRSDVKTLRELGRAFGVRYYYQLRKGELITALTPIVELRGLPPGVALVDNTRNAAE